MLKWEILDEKCPINIHKISEFFLRETKLIKRLMEQQNRVAPSIGVPLAIQLAKKDLTFSYLQLKNRGGGALSANIILDVDLYPWSPSWD